MSKRDKEQTLNSIDLQITQIILSSKDKDELDSITESFENIKNNAMKAIQEKTVDTSQQLKDENEKLKKEMEEMKKEMKKMMEMKEMMKSILQ
jgi:cell shape-determining protein MreC